MSCRLLKVVLFVSAFSCVLLAAGRCLAQGSATQPADLLKGAVDPYDAAAERAKFFKATGVESEMTEAIFNADAKAGGNFARPFDSWKAMLGYDKNGNGKIDWFEADAYRQALRAKVLELFDKKKTGSLAGADRQAANALLASGKPILGRMPIGTGPITANPEFDQQQVDLMDRIVGLTAGQKRKMMDLLEARVKDAQAFYRDNGEKIQAASDAAVDAAKANDSSALAKAQKGVEAVYAPLMEIQKKSQADVMAVLTDAQRTTYLDYQLRAAMRSVTHPLELGDEQFDKLKKAASDVYTPEGKITDYAKFCQKVQEVLTGEQKAAIHKDRSVSTIKRHFARAGLTEEQMGKIAAAYDDLAKDKTLNEGQIYNKLMQVTQSLLTDEQKEVLNKPMKSERAVH